MKKRTLKKRDRVLYLLLLAFSALFILLGNRYTRTGALMFTGQTSVQVDTYVVRVDAVLDTKIAENTLGNMPMTQTTIKYSGTILAGARRGETLVATQSFDNLTSLSHVAVEPGDWVFVHLTPATSSDYYTGNFFRLRQLVPVAVLFFVLLLVFARAKGFNSIIALGFSILSIFLVFIPAILSGKNIYLWALLICAYSIVITPFFIGGFSRKSVAAALGCIGGVAVAGALTALLDAWMKITGSVDEETMMVSFILDEPIDLRAITFAAILIGALGAALDVSMSIASSVSELNDVQGGGDFKTLVRSGMNIGRDIIGTQISTLLLAYIGGSLSVTLLLVAYQNSLVEMLNIEMVVIELLQALVGCYTILFTIPATALVCGSMFTGERPRRTAQTAPVHKQRFSKEDRQ